MQFQNYCSFDPSWYSTVHLPTKHSSPKTNPCLAWRVTWTHHWSSRPRNTYSPVCSRWTTPHRAPPQRIVAHGIGWHRELVIWYLKLTVKGRNINSYPRFWLKSPTWHMDQTRVKALCLYDSICLCEYLALALCNDVKAMWSQVAVHHQHWNKNTWFPGWDSFSSSSPAPTPARIPMHQVDLPPPRRPNGNARVGHQRKDHH